MYDFPIKELGRVTPYGVYDLAANDGWVSVGIDHDTAAFAVATIRHWWEQVGQARYPQSDRLLITADGGGSNGSRIRLWKRELQQLATETGLAITVCHYPPGTSKWNKIEHRLFAFITPELARAPPGQLCGDPQPDCQHDHQHGAEGGELPGYRHLPDRRQRQ